MSGEIKELNNAIQRITHSVVVHTPKYSKYGGYDGENDIYTMDIAKALHTEGYCKQSEWISVDERLPEEDTRVLVCLDPKSGYIKIDTDRMFPNGMWMKWGYNVTHWMPLPEGPKMKGGE